MWSVVNWCDVCEVISFWCEVKWSYVEFLGIRELKWDFSVNKWSDVKCSELTWCMWSDFVLMWSEVELRWVLGDKSAMHIRVTLHWGYMIILWLFHLVCIFYCGCFNLFCNVWVWVYVGFIMCGCFGNMCTSIYYVLYNSYYVFGIVSFMYIFSYLFVSTSVRTTATEWQLNCS